jgi:multidrug efflux system membrane fusion protein
MLNALRWPVAARLAPLLSLALILSGCGDAPPAGAKGGGGKSGKGGGSPAPVLVSQAQMRVVPLTIEAIGAIEPLRSSTIRSQVAGTLQKIAIREGQDVKEGDLLFEIDPRPFRSALLTAEADLERLKVQIDTARAQVERYRALNTAQMVSKEVFQKLVDDVRALEAELKAGEARVTSARVQLEYCSIRAPISGRTGNIAVDEGDLVRSNDAGALVTIHQLNPIYVTFGVPQQHLAAINRYKRERPLAVTVVPPGVENEPERGTLTFVDNTVDSATGTIRLKGTFTNDRGRLWPGQFAAVTLTLAEPEVLTVATSAIQTSQTGQHVFVVSADRIAELRPVTIERSHEALAVVASGLKAGETVVVDGQLRVIPGRAVEIKTPATPGVPAAKPAGETAGAKGKDTRKKKET